MLQEKSQLHSSEQLGLTRLSNVETAVAVRDFSRANKKVPHQDTT